MRHLVIVFGDQLDRASAALDGFDSSQDAIWMAEVRREGEEVWSHRARIALFLAAMRHYRNWLRREKGWPVMYVELDDPANTGSFSGELRRTLAAHRPQKLIVVEPGEWRVAEGLRQLMQELGVPLEVRPDRHFFTGVDEFRMYAQGRGSLRLEYFYREQRRRHGVLLTGQGTPEGGAWNFDHDNRAALPAGGPADLPPPPSFPPDRVTRAVLELVERQFPGHPGSLESFFWPVTAEDAEVALDDFITHRLPAFGRYQDAMWTDQPFLWHSLLSSSLNLKLLHPRAAVAAAEAAYRDGRVPLAAAEGFIRQILGWREYVRGHYWLHMPEYLNVNALKADQSLPEFYWTGATPFACLRHTIGQTLAHGYAHHIQRLMVTGLYALMLGVRPRAVHEWYLAMYVDAIEWVELPNTLGMSQFADGGRLASKPYIATGKYIQRMSNYCTHCPRHPAHATGPTACPFTTLYWDFLIRHQARLGAHPRLRLQFQNLDRLTPGRRAVIQAEADNFRRHPDGTGPPAHEYVET